MKKYILVCDECKREMGASTSAPLRQQLHLRVGLTEMFIDPADNGLIGSEHVRVLFISDICPDCYKKFVLEEAARLQEESKC